MSTEINITEFFTESTAIDYNASRAEIGQDAGPATWRAACAGASKYALITDDNRDAFKTHIRGFGAWDDAEIAAMSHTELNALFIQVVAGDIREAGLDQSAPDWAEYQADSEAGRVSGSIYRDDSGQIYYSIDG